LVESAQISTSFAKQLAVDSASLLGTGHLHDGVKIPWLSIVDTAIDLRAKHRAQFIIP
jgi:hypothetical protein